MHPRGGVNSADQRSLGMELRRVRKIPKNEIGKAGFWPAFASSILDCYFLGAGAIASLVAFATRNFTTVLALIWMGSPVCGLRPMRALR